MIDEQLGRILAVLDQLGLADDTALLFTADHGEFTGAHRLHVDELPALAGVRRQLMSRLYDVLRERGDNFYHWTTSMFEVGEKSYDTSLSALDEDASRRSGQPSESGDGM